MRAVFGSVRILLFFSSRLNQQLDDYRGLIEQLQADERIHVKRISSLEKELVELAGMLKSSGDVRVEELRTRIKIEVRKIKKVSGLSVLRFFHRNPQHCEIWFKAFEAYFALTL